MTPLEPDHEDLHTRAARILRTMGDTPIPAMDATFYAHYAEELLTDRHPAPASVTRVWLVWNCPDIAGSYSTEHAAREARADLQHQLLCQYGPEADLLESITITTAHVPTKCLARIGATGEGRQPRSPGPRRGLEPRRRQLQRPHRRMVTLGGHVCRLAHLVGPADRTHRTRHRLRPLPPSRPNAPTSPSCLGTPASPPATATATAASTTPTDVTPSGGERRE